MKWQLTYDLKREIVEVIEYVGDNVQVISEKGKRLIVKPHQLLSLNNQE